ncbi:methylated-DNA--[protein]-cysteine S-methyltransferase [Agitococcus lubricus]|uniref:methylated-DNA--[protein]-cysteine S-methyltransferase n=1 Tax=Agitococcus lubricus TaxID=1077255 RepID=A0A2T5IX04_9GAMM|nr:methylated-DNA--[protein]-cysteine S-methyltransferase [Agitococcus lubricus]PTQ88443.1 methylated-DNA-[protein]-cysteine S-methyltransferase [Agitococcus lubricus]
MSTIYTSTLSSPLGLLYLAHANDILYALDFVEFPERFLAQRDKYAHQAHFEDGELSTPIRQHLQDYFAGELSVLNQIRVHTQGTAFQQGVWHGLRQIPVGDAWSYKQLAQQLHHPQSQRAIGMANSKNPIPLVIPCHRVINSNGQLGGYSGALWRKEWLLRHEGFYSKTKSSY